MSSHGDPSSLCGIRFLFHEDLLYIHTYIYIVLHISRIVCHEQRTKPPPPKNMDSFRDSKTAHLTTIRSPLTIRTSQGGKEGRQGVISSNKRESQKTSMASLDKRGTKLSGTDGKFVRTRRRRRRDDGDFSRRGWLDISAEAEIKRYGDSRGGMS